MNKIKKIENQVCEDYINKIPITEIALKNNCSTSLVKNIIRQNNLNNRIIKLPENDICKLYQDKLLIKDIAKIYNVHWQTISRIIRKKKISTRNNIRQHKDEIIKMHIENNIPIIEIAKHYNTTVTNVLYHFKENNIQNKYPNKIYQHNYSYFEKIDSEHKAYWLGFIAADGNISRTTLHIGIHVKDAELLLKFKESIQATNPVIFKEYISKGKLSKICRIDLYSRKTVNDLFNLGIIENKSLILDWDKIIANIPHELIRHFLRGVFDGDGSWKQNNKPTFSIASSSKKFIIGLKKWIINECDLTDTKIREKNVSKNTGYSYDKGGRFNLAIIYDLLYKDAAIYLDRKFKIIKNYLRN